MPHYLREDLPESGHANCNHTWERVNDPNLREGQILLVCKRCSASRIAGAPLKMESKKEKPLLME